MRAAPTDVHNVHTFNFRWLCCRNCTANKDTNVTGASCFSHDLAHGRHADVVRFNRAVSDMMTRGLVDAPPAPEPAPKPEPVVEEAKAEEPKAEEPEIKPSDVIIEVPKAEEPAPEEGKEQEPEVVLEG